MKNIILIVIVLLVVCYSLKSLFKSLTGKGGCSCGTNKNSSSCSSCSSCKDKKINKVN